MDERALTLGEARPLTVAVTGASGFVGRALVSMLAADQRFVCRACYRTAPGEIPEGAELFVTGELDGPAGWTAALTGADAVVHTAARAHVLRETEADALAAHRRVNVEGTLALARAAAAVGVQRFVYLSSIGVLGESTPVDRPFVESDLPAPQRAYSQSKLEAEEKLALLAAETGLEVVVLRPPLVYGRAARGNIGRLMRMIELGVPLPLGAIRNRRSLISLPNLCTAIGACLAQPQAAGRTYLVSDQRDLSTPELVTLLAESLGRRVRLWPVPVTILRMIGQLAGRGDEVSRLTGSLCIDSSRISRELGWQPIPPSVERDPGSLQ